MTPEKIALQKFLQEKPDASAKEIQSFLRTGKAVRSPAAVALSKFLDENPEAKAKDVSDFSETYNGAQARARKLGTQSAVVDVAVREADGAAQQALEKSAAVSRGNWVPINEIQQNIARKASSPAQRVFDQANGALITAYSQTMSRTGANTVTAQNRAIELLNTADGPEAYKAGVKQLQTEMKIVQQAVRDVESGAASESQEPTSGSASDPLGIR